MQGFGCIFYSENVEIKLLSIAFKHANLCKRLSYRLNFVVHENHSNIFYDRIVFLDILFQLESVHSFSKTHCTENEVFH